MILFNLKKLPGAVHFGTENCRKMGPWNSDDLHPGLEFLKVTKNANFVKNKNHLIQRVGPHVVDDAENQLPVFLIQAHEEGIVHNVLKRDQHFLEGVQNYEKRPKTFQLT